MPRVSKTLKSAIERLGLLPRLCEEEELLQAAIFLDFHTYLYRKNLPPPDGYTFRGEGLISYEVYALTSQRLCIMTTHEKGGGNWFEAEKGDLIHIQTYKKDVTFTCNDLVIPKDMSIIIKNKNGKEWQDTFSVKEYENEKDFHNDLTREEFFDVVTQHWKE